MIGPTLAAQFDYLPGTLWILIGAVLGGCWLNQQPDLRQWFDYDGPQHPQGSPANIVGTANISEDVLRSDFFISRIEWGKLA